MSQIPPVIDSAVHELAVGCEFAHVLMSGAKTVADSRAVQLLKNHLGRVHRRHVDQLRASALRPRMTIDLRARCWTDMAGSLQSPDDNVVIAACALLERALLGTFERTLAHSSLASQTRRLLHRQRQELKCCYEYYVCRLPAWRRSPAAGRPSPKPGAAAFATAA